MIAAIAARHPRAGAALLAAAAAGAAALPLAGGDLAPVAARAALAAAGLAALALVARRRRAAAPAPAQAALAVVARQALARDAGIAVVEAGGRRLLVGFGPGGVTRLARLGAAAGEERAP